MAHVSTQIRAAVYDLLFNTTAAGQRVYKTKTLPYQERYLSVFPAIGIYSTGSKPDPVEGRLCGLSIQTHSVAIELFIQQNDDADDALDDLRAEVEALVIEDPTLGGIAVSGRLDSTESKLYAESERLLISCALYFEFVTVTAEADPTVAL
jgi:hypothetical protein